MYQILDDFRAALIIRRHENNPVMAAIMKVRITHFDGLNMGVKKTRTHAVLRSTSPAQPAILPDVVGDSDIIPKHTARVAHLSRNLGRDLVAEAQDREGYLKQPQSPAESRIWEAESSWLEE